MALSTAERRQLAATLGCSTTELKRELLRYHAAAAEEYVRMFLGQRVFTRGSDIREWRLCLIIQHALGGRLPSETLISGLFQTTTTQSRALLRAVMSKYQYELQGAIRGTLQDAIGSARQPPGRDDWLITIDSENVIDALNREIIAVDGTLPQIARARGTASTYEVQESSLLALRERLG